MGHPPDPTLQPLGTPTPDALRRLEEDRDRRPDPVPPRLVPVSRVRTPFSFSPISPVCPEKGRRSGYGVVIYLFFVEKCRV